MAFQKPNFTPIPNTFLEDIVPTLSNSALRIMLFAMRNTFGWSSYWENPTPRTMGKEWLAEQIGISPRSAFDGVKELCDNGYLVLVDYKGSNGAARYLVPVEGDTWKALPCEDDADKGSIENDQYAKSAYPEDQHYAKSAYSNVQNLHTLKDSPKDNKENISAKADLVANANDGNSVPMDNEPEELPTLPTANDLHVRDLKDEPLNVIGLIQSVFKKHKIRMTEKQKQRLLQTVDVMNADGSFTTYPSPETLAATNDDFRRFVKQRLRDFKSMWEKQNKEPLLATLVGSIIKYDKPGKSSKKWDGWLLWQKDKSILHNAAFQTTNVVRKSESAPQEPRPWEAKEWQNKVANEPAPWEQEND